MPGVDDIGIGLAPERVGHGLSRWLLPTVITALRACGALKGSVLRAVILDWNHRSISAAQHAGFAVIGEQHVGQRRFLVLTRAQVISASQPSASEG